MSNVQPCWCKSLSAASQCQLLPWTGRTQWLIALTVEENLEQLMHVWMPGQSSSLRGTYQLVHPCWHCFLQICRRFCHWYRWQCRQRECLNLRWRWWLRRGLNPNTSRSGCLLQKMLVGSVGARRQKLFDAETWSDGSFHRLFVQGWATRLCLAPSHLQLGSQSRFLSSCQLLWNKCSPCWNLCFLVPLQKDKREVVSLLSRGPHDLPPGQTDF